MNQRVPTHFLVGDGSAHWSGAAARSTQHLLGQAFLLVSTALPSLHGARLAPVRSSSPIGSLRFYHFISGGSSATHSFTLGIGQRFAMPLFLRSEVPLLAAAMSRLRYHSLSQLCFLSGSHSISQSVFSPPVGRYLLHLPARNNHLRQRALEATLVAQERAPLFTSGGLRSPENRCHHLCELGLTLSLKVAHHHQEAHVGDVLTISSVHLGLIYRT